MDIDSKQYILCTRRIAFTRVVVTCLVSEAQQQVLPSDFMETRQRETMRMDCGVMPAPTGSSGRRGAYQAYKMHRTKATPSRSRTRAVAIA